MTISNLMYLRMWIEDLTKDHNVYIRNYNRASIGNTPSWDLLGTIPARTKAFQQFEIDMTDHYNPLDDTTEIRLTTNNGRISIDKIIFTSSDLVETIKRVEQVDFVRNVECVDKINQPSMDVHGTEYG